MQPTWIAGVDGCRAGWVVCLRDLTAQQAPRIRVEPRFVDIVDAVEHPIIVAVDMPIGLPERTERGGRGPEILVRPLLGKRRVSIFPIPSRSAVYAVVPQPIGMRALLDGHKTASAIGRAHSASASGVQFQSFNIFPKIREIDELLLKRPDLMTVIYESHPEVAFWQMNGRSPLLHAKKPKASGAADGANERRNLLARGGLAAELISHPTPRGGVAPDDVIDAMAMSIVAERVHRREAVPFPDPPGRDAYGLPVAIWA